MGSLYTSTIHREIHALKVRSQVKWIGLCNTLVKWNVETQNQACDVTSRIFSLWVHMCTLLHAAVKKVLVRINCEDIVNINIYKNNISLVGCLFSFCIGKIKSNAGDLYVTISILFHFFFPWVFWLSYNTTIESLCLTNEPQKTYQ